MATSGRSSRPKTGQKRKQRNEPLEEYRRKRDFDATGEPRGTASRAAGHRGLRFVIQKHAASSLHYDLRLELDGVMRSWAVPKGPSLDPSTKRLAMEVEDHPIEYNTFEGTIPPGEYGGGTVMLWDRGTYRPDEMGKGEDAAGAVRRGLKAGKLSVTLAGERLRGSFALVRTDRGDKPKWLLIKHRDEDARRTGDITEEVLTSVATGRTLDEIAADNDRVWKSNRTGDASRGTRGSAGDGGDARGGNASRGGARGRNARSGNASGGTSSGGGKRGRAKSAAPGAMIAPMRPEPARAVPEDGEWTYEVWRGGDRVLAYVTHDTAVLMDEEANDVTVRLRAIADELESLAGRAGRPFVLDGEIEGDADDAIFHASDLLLDGDQVLLDRAWRDRRAALESLFRRRRVKRIGLQKIGSDAAAMMRRAARGGWPGMFARRTDAPYEPGSRSAALLRIAAH